MAIRDDQAGSRAAGEAQPAAGLLAPVTRLALPGEERADLLLEELRRGRVGSPVKAGERRWLDGLYLDAPEKWDDPYRFFRW